jgi:hypothetical protein
MALPTFIAIYLSDVSKKALLAAVPAIHPKVFAEHLTVMFKPHDMVVQQFAPKLGQLVLLTVDGVASDDKGQAVHIKEQLLRMDKGVAHITISCAPLVPPKYSMELLEKGFTPLAKPISLWGTYEHARKAG